MDTFGEAFATAIVLFGILLALAQGEARVGPGDIAHAAVEFVRVFFGGVAVGVGLLYWSSVLRSAAGPAE